MTIQTTHLRAFLQAAARIKTNPQVRAYGFIRFQDGTITKNNLREFVQYSCDFSGIFLIEERILANFIAATKSEGIEITYSDKRVTLSDGFTKVSSPNEDILNFPTNDQPTGPAFTLSAEVCQAIGIAGQLLSEEEIIHPNCKHVFIGGKLVSGTDQWISYCQEFSDDLPQIMLSKAPALLVGRLEGAKYSDSQSYDFFQSGDFLYGFIKPECLWFDMSILLRKVDLPAWTIDKAQLISFCEICLSASPIDGLTATMAKGEDLTLLMQDSSFEVDVVKQVEVIGDQCEVFEFQPKLLLRLLKALPAQEIKAWRNKHNYYFTSGNFTGAIQGIITK